MEPHGAYMVINRKSFPDANVYKPYPDWWGNAVRYSGPTDIHPSWTDQVLPTGQTFVDDNIIIHAITFADIAQQFPVYNGDRTITPTGETQTFPTAGTIVLEDLTVNPIPSNYGLITWNGSVLTVS